MEDLIREAREIARHERTAQTRDGDPMHEKIAAVLTDMADLYPGESEPIHSNPVLRGVDLAIDRLVRRDCFTGLTLRILDELRAEIAGVATQEELRATYPPTVLPDRSK